MHATNKCFQKRKYLKSSKLHQGKLTKILKPCVNLMWTLYKVVQKPWASRSLPSEGIVLSSLNKEVTSKLS